jgi:hypothetical protein
VKAEAVVDLGGGKRRTRSAGVRKLDLIALGRQRLLHDAGMLHTFV